MTRSDHCRTFGFAGQLTNEAPELGVMALVSLFASLAVLSLLW